MKGLRGKLSSMAGHAFLHAFWDATKPRGFGSLHAQQASNYQDSGLAGKITLVVDTVEELIVLQESYKDICGTSLVTDAGRTVFKEPTTICLGIGPIDVDNIKEDLSELKVLV